MVKRTRRTSAEVLDAKIDQMRVLESEKKALEAEQAVANNPLSLALGIKIANIVLQIASLLRSVKAFKKK